MTTRQRSTRVLVGSDNFKGSPTAVEVAAHLGEGLSRVAAVQTDLLPLADGGGSVDVAAAQASVA